MTSAAVELSSVTDPPEPALCLPGRCGFFLFVGSSCRRTTADITVQWPQPWLLHRH